MKRVLLSVLLTLAACSKAGPDLPASMGTKQGDMAQVQTLYDKANGMLKAASTREDIVPTMQAFEEVLAVAPDHKDALVAASMLHYHHGNDVLTEKDKDARLATWLKGRDYGLRAMGLNPTFRAEYEKDNTMEKQVVHLGEADAGALLWTGLNWAKWGELYGIIRAAMDIPKVVAIMNRVNEVAPKQNCGGAYRFFIGYWVSIPGFMGRDAKKSTTAYEAVTKSSPECQISHDVVYAWYFAREVEDKELWTKLLEKAIATPVPDDSPARMMLKLSQLEAKDHLAKTKEIFE